MLLFPSTGSSPICAKETADDWVLTLSRPVLATLHSRRERRVKDFFDADDFAEADPAKLASGNWDGLWS
jgi:hypothetical protein